MLGSPQNFFHYIHFRKLLQTALRTHITHVLRPAEVYL